MCVCTYVIAKTFLQALITLSRKHVCVCIRGWESCPHDMAMLHSLSHIVHCRPPIVYISQLANI